MTPLEAFHEIESRVKPVKGFTQGELAGLERKTGYALPAGVRELLARCSGFSIGDWSVRFGGLETDAFESPAGDPQGLVIASSDEGNFWLVEVAAAGWGAVHYFSHDPPVVIQAAPDLATFIIVAADPRCVQQAGEAALQAWPAGEELPASEAASSLIAFVARELSVPEQRLKLSTRIRKDLGVDGDDGLDFVGRFGKAFGVDLAAFKPRDYFGPEASSPLSFLSPRWWKNRSRYKEITIRDLLESARLGAWLKRQR